MVFLILGEDYLFVGVDVDDGVGCVMFWSYCLVISVIGV